MSKRSFFYALIGAALIVVALWLVSERGGRRETAEAPAVAVETPASETEAPTLTAATSADAADTPKSTVLPPAAAPPPILFEPTQKDLELLALLERHRIDTRLGIKALEAVHTGQRDDSLRQWIRTELRGHLAAQAHITNWAIQTGHIKSPPPPNPTPKKRAGPAIKPLQKTTP